MPHPWGHHANAPHKQHRHQDQDVFSPKDCLYQEPTGGKIRVAVDNKIVQQISKWITWFRTDSGRCSGNWASTPWAVVKRNQRWHSWSGWQWKLWSAVPCTTHQCYWLCASERGGGERPSSQHWESHLTSYLIGRGLLLLWISLNRSERTSM